MSKLARRFAAVFLAVCFPVPTSAQSWMPSAAKRCVSQYIATQPSRPKPHIAAAQAGLDNRNGRETLAYLVGRGWCDAVGCTLLIVQSVGSECKLVAQATKTQLPVLISRKRTHEWRDVLVTIASDTPTLPNRIAALMFDGEKYPDDPTLLPHDFGVDVFKAEWAIVRHPAQPPKE